jgi:hypothetical protein
MKKSFVLFCLIIIQNIFSQNTSSKRFYEISFCGKPQTVKLVEYPNGTVEGFLKIELTEEKANGKESEIIKKIKFNDTLTRKLLADLKSGGIETLKQCNEDVECKKQGFLDGDAISIKIISNEVIKDFYFSEIYPESQNNGKLEEIELRRKVQILATIIDKEINLEKQFSETIKNLKSGTYCYWSGITQICRKHKYIR